MPRKKLTPMPAFSSLNHGPLRRSGHRRRPGGLHGCQACGQGGSSYYSAGGACRCGLAGAVRRAAGAGGPGGVGAGGRLLHPGWDEGCHHFFSRRSSPGLQGPGSPGLGGGPQALRPGSGGAGSGRGGHIPALLQGGGVQARSGEEHPLPGRRGGDLSRGGDLC